MSVASTSNGPPVYDNKQISDSTNEQSTSLNERRTTNGNQIVETVKSKPRRRAQFTRGEKCLFIHLVVTFGMLLLLFIIYIVHLYWVKHKGYDMFDGILRLGKAKEKSDFMPVGVVYVLPDYYMCNCLLLRPTWSIAPAHCVAARSDPDLAYALPSWRITYGRIYEYSTNTDDNDIYVETTIIRGVAHPHFNRDDYQNNIGLFEHTDSIHAFSYATINDESLNDATLEKNAADLKLVAWEDSWQLHGHAVQNEVVPLSSEKCKQDVSPILDLRAYEYCVQLMANRNVSIEWLGVDPDGWQRGNVANAYVCAGNTYKVIAKSHSDPRSNDTHLPLHLQRCGEGKLKHIDLPISKENAAPGAVLATKSAYLGMFAWGDSSGLQLPFVILDFAHYKNWILYIISVYVK